MPTLPLPCGCRAVRVALTLVMLVVTAAASAQGIDAAAQAAGLPAASTAVRQPRTETFHGRTLVDDYRDLEDPTRPETRAWLDAQGRHAATTLARIAGREALARRITTLAESAGDRINDLWRLPGGQLVYLERRAGDNQYKLVMRERLGAPRRVLVDPEALSARPATGKRGQGGSATPVAIDWFTPSWDGRTLAYGLSEGGSEDSSLHLMDVATGRSLLKAPLPHVTNGLVHFSPDSRWLTYNQLRELPAGTPANETYLDSTVYLLEVPRPGQAAGRPVALFGPLVNRNLGLERLDVAEVIFQPGSAWMLARCTDTTVPEGRSFVAPLSELARLRTTAAGGQAAAALRWQAVARAEHQVTGYALRGDELWLRSTLGAPSGRLLSVALSARQAAAPGGTTGTAAPLVQQARERLAEPRSGVLKGFGIGPQALYTELQLGFETRVRRHALPPAGRAAAATTAAAVVGEPQDVLPAQAGSARLVADPAQRLDEVWVQTQSWTDVNRLLAVAGSGSAPARDTTLLRSERPAAAADITVTELMVPSHDGAQVPLAILHRKDLVLDGSAPAILIGYGAYGVSFETHFDPRRLAWLEQGGVVAYVNVRGSGAFGEAWHRAGFKQTKPNTWKDGIAAAQYLITRGFTQPGRLAVWGTSAGGIFAGRILTSTPRLIGAAVLDVGMLDAIHGEDTANGITNISEFGTVKDAAEFAALHEMSSYHQVQDGTAYPAVLLIHGLNDPRVDYWNSAKMAARLQAASSSGRPVLLRLDGQAGHGMGSTRRQGVDKLADIYAFLRWQFGLAELQPAAP